MTQRSDAVDHSAIVEFLAREFDEHTDTVARTREQVAAEFAQLVAVCTEALRAGQKIMLFGNGGSAADAQHLATELVVRYRVNRRALPAIALTTDTSAICRAGDVAIGISTSGKSENVIRGLQAAKAAGAITVAFTGDGGGRLANQVDIGIFIPSTITARIQEMHLLLGHVLCDLLERESRV